MTLHLRGSLRMILCCALSVSATPQMTCAMDATRSPATDSSPKVFSWDVQLINRLLIAASLPPIQTYDGLAIRYTWIDNQSGVAVIVQLVEVDQLEKSAQLLAKKLNLNDHDWFTGKDDEWSLVEEADLSVSLVDLDNILRDLLTIVSPHSDEITADWRQGNLVVCPSHRPSLMEIAVDRGGSFVLARADDCSGRRAAERAGESLIAFARNQSDRIAAILAH